MQSYLSNYNKYTEYLFQSSENLIAFGESSAVILNNNDTRINENLRDSDDTPKNNKNTLEDDNFSSLSTQCEEDACETPHFGGYKYESFESCFGGNISLPKNELNLNQK